MKKTILLLVFLAAFVCLAKAQPLETTHMVGITPVVCEDMQLPADGRSALTAKLLQMATQNGFGSTSGRFALTPMVVVTDKQVLSGAPSQYMVELEVVLYVVDAVEQTIFDQLTLNVKGVDRLENKAFIQAINSINTRSATVRAFMAGLREKILDYYATSMPNIMLKTDALIEAGECKKAYAILSDIPDWLDEYPIVADRIATIRQSCDFEAEPQVVTRQIIIHQVNRFMAPLLRPVTIR